MSGHRTWARGREELREGKGCCATQGGKGLMRRSCLREGEGLLGRIYGYVYIVYWICFCYQHRETTVIWDRRTFPPRTDL